MSTSIDPSLLEVIASDLGVDPSFVEKDWYAMRVIATLITVSKFDIKLVFAGGTSLSKGFGLIQRFSEDLDFKVILPVSNPKRKQLGDYRRKILEVIRNSSSDWSLNGKEESRDENRRFSCNISYQRKFYQSNALRPDIKLDVNFSSPVLLPVEEKALTSFISQAMEQPPEVPLIACVSPVETAAEKISALTWRVLTRNRENENDDPSLVRHLHDLMALNQVIENYQGFSSLVFSFIKEDFEDNRGKIQSLGIPKAEFLPRMLHELESDTIYNDEYQKFVMAMSYATEDECPTFNQCIQNVRSIITRLETI